jgi:hypothetical protein
MSASTSAAAPAYWTVSRGPAVRPGTCRECRRAIAAGDPVVARDGRKIRLFYHEACFSGDADPRTQAVSSAAHHHVTAAAPAVKGRGKWSTGSYGYAPRLETGTGRSATR